MYERILVPIDGSATAERGLHEAIGLAAQLKCRLHVLHVVDDFPLLVEVASVESYNDTMARLRKYGEHLLSDAASRARDAGVEVQTRQRDATPKRIAQTIVDEAVQAGCSLIVMGTHGRRGFSRMTLGSDAEEVVRSGPVPVLLVRHPEDSEPA